MWWCASIVQHNQNVVNKVQNFCQKLAKICKPRFQGKLKCKNRTTWCEKWAKTPLFCPKNRKFFAKTKIARLQRSNLHFFKAKKFVNFLQNLPNYKKFQTFFKKFLRSKNLKKAGRGRKNRAVLRYNFCTLKKFSKMGRFFALFLI